MVDYADGKLGGVLTVERVSGLSVGNRSNTMKTTYVTNQVSSLVLLVGCNTSCDKSSCRRSLVLAYMHTDNSSKRYKVPQGGVDD